MSILRSPVRIVVALAVLAVIAVVTAGLVGTWSSSVARAQGAGVNTAGFPTGAREPGIFTDTCQRTLTAPNDPILMPGMTGASMQHDFFGAPKVSASTTSADLVGGPSACSTTADASAYWTPVLYQHGVALPPTSTLLYWRTTPQQTGTTAPMPAGISLIAGDEKASAPQDPAVANWTCTARAGVRAPRSGTPHDCPAGSQVRLVMTFPECWDGHSLDGAKQTNAVYDTDGVCPAGHPVRIPQIVLHVAYPTSSADGLTLSIGPTTRGSTDTAHADFVDGWNQERMAADTAACIDTRTRCGRTVGPLATPLGGKDQPVVRQGASGA